MAVISVHYDEDDQSTYKGVEISYQNLQNHEKFESGNFVVDWFMLIRFIANSDIEAVENISYSSSVDHFIMDGDRYKPAYLIIKENQKPLLSYNKNDYKIGIEFFTDHNTKDMSWDQFSNYCYKQMKLI